MNDIPRSPSTSWWAMLAPRLSRLGKPPNWAAHAALLDGPDRMCPV
jgi:hypothetical protein